MMTFYNEKHGGCTANRLCGSKLKMHYTDDIDGKNSPNQADTKATNMAYRRRGLINYTLVQL